MAEVMEQEKVQLLNANTGRPDTHIPRKRYDAMKAALLTVIPESDEGVAYKLLSKLASPKLPGWWHDQGWSVSWHVAAVKLDFEARGVIERKDGSGPMYVRKASGNSGSGNGSGNNNG